jgi:hypothetical protein
MALIQLDTDSWAAAGNPTQTGSNDSNDISNDINVAIQSLNGALNTVGFMQNTKIFITAMEEFGEGMEAALACVSVDLAVVASGMKAAAAAFSQLEAKLGSTLTQMDQQLAYFTNTKSSVTLPTPTAADQSAQQALEGNPSVSSSSGVHLSYPTVNPSTAAGAGAAGIAIIMLGILVIA